jgi:cytochrome P450
VPKSSLRCQLCPSYSDAVINDAVYRNAGVDTIEIAMTRIVHELIQHPHMLAELYQELDEQQKNVKVRHAHTEFSQLPFFHNCCREAMRLHPSVAMPLPRHVPSDGSTVSGFWFPPGIRIGISPHVVHHDKGAFGPDVDSFNPHRWSQNQESSMAKAMLLFGNGSRACPGRPVSTTDPVRLSV